MNLKPISRRALVSRPFECRWTESEMTDDAGLQQARRLRIEEVGLAAHFVHRPGGGARRLAGQRRQVERVGGVELVLLDRAAASARSCGGRRSGRRRSARPLPDELDVVHLAHFDRRHVAVLGEAGRRGRDLAPPVGRAGLDQRPPRCCTTRSGSPIDQRVLSFHTRGRRHVGGVAARRAGVGPLARSARSPRR